MDDAGNGVGRGEGRGARGRGGRGRGRPALLPIHMMSPEEMRSEYRRVEHRVLTDMRRLRELSAVANITHGMAVVGTVYRGARDATSAMAPADDETVHVAMWSNTRAGTAWTTNAGNQTLMDLASSYGSHVKSTAGQAVPDYGESASKRNLRVAEVVQLLKDVELASGRRAIQMFFNAASSTTDDAPKGLSMAADVRCR